MKSSALAPPPYIDNSRIWINVPSFYKKILSPLLDDFSNIPMLYK